MLRSRHYVTTAVLIGLVIGCLAYGLSLQKRNQEIDRLFAEASGDAPYFRGTEEAQNAVERLGNFRGEKITALLLEIASGKTPNVWPVVQRKAIEMLSRRGEENVGESIARLLQPHLALMVRHAAATALETLPCRQACVASVLHYLERISSGELNYEERSQRGNFAEDLWAQAIAVQKREQEALYESLYRVLSRNGATAVDVLNEIYGLGTAGVSRFAVSVVQRAEIREACPNLLRSQQAVNVGLESAFIAPRRELVEAIASLHCQ